MVESVKGHTVFISYSHADREFVDQLADRLKASGVNVWIDKWMIKVGDSITDKINEGIGASDWLIVVLSCASVSSKWVREELNAAMIRNIEQGKHAFILPILIEECELPIILRHRKYANFKDDPEYAFQELLEVVRPDPLMLEPELTFIPAGEFLIGSDPQKDKDAQKGEQPQHKLYLPDYYIAKMPITNTQYLAFVDATFRQIPKHWEPGKPPAGKEQHPVVNVSWHDGMAYCQWLRERTGRAYALPSEAEWEKAARGTDGRIYPWGDEWDPTRCNTTESGRYGTTPVGRFSPQGDSPYGCVDMAGRICKLVITFSVCCAAARSSSAVGRSAAPAASGTTRTTTTETSGFERWWHRCDSDLSTLWTRTLWLSVLWGKGISSPVNPREARRQRSRKAKDNNQRPPPSSPLSPSSSMPSPSRSGPPSTTAWRGRA
jgi:formylglycine-generating enzyme required for sulfatase activity